MQACTIMIVPRNGRHVQLDISEKTRNLVGRSMQKPADPFFKFGDGINSIQIAQGFRLSRRVIDILRQRGLL